MVVLTFLLARAAYKRYNSSEDVEQRQEQVKNRSDHYYPTQSLRHTNSSSSSSRRVIQKKNQSNNIKRLASRKKFRNKMSSAANNSQTMKMASEDDVNNIIPSNNGHFVINTKAKIIMLPPELPNSSNSTTTNNNVGGHLSKKKSNEINNNTSNNNNSQPISSIETSSQQQPDVLLSSKEMTMAMMGELSTTNQNNIERSSTILLEDGSSDDNNNTRGGKNNKEENHIIIGKEEEEEEEYMVINNTNTTFRNDVRNEWVDAVFGIDFFPLKEDSKEGMDIGIKQGIGNANIPHYVTYGAILDASNNNNNNDNDNDNANNNTMNKRNNGLNKTHHSHSTPSLTSSSKIQESTQSTPLIFTSSSLGLGDGGPTSSLLASTSFVNACGGGGVESSTGGGGGDDDGQGMMNHNMLFDTPAGGARRSGTEDRNSARYTTIEGSTNYTPIVGSIPTPNQQHRNSQQQQKQQPNKLGITISRIPLGLYVHSIKFDSEAYAVGISPGSILVEINGMGMLCDRSDRALERIWCYTGLFSGGSSTTNNNNIVVDEAAGGDEKKSVKRNMSNGNLHVSVRNSSTTTTNNTTTNNDSARSSGSGSSTTTNQELHMKKPILLKFYKHGHTYTKLLLSGNPLRGITWAPCGNFALVHKVSNNSIASDAGVRRGTLVVGVNNIGLRTLDHGGVAAYLKDKFTNGESITLSMGYTPAASRSGHYEREEKSNGLNSSHHKREQSSSSPIPNGGAALAAPLSSTTASDNNAGGGMNYNRSSNNSFNSIRDVEVRSRPVEYSSAMVETFFACTGPGAMGMVDDTPLNSSSQGMINRDGNNSNNNNRSMMSSSSHHGSSSFRRGSSSHDIMPASSAGMAEVVAYVAAGGILPPVGGVLEAASTMTRQYNTRSSNGGTHSRRPIMADATKNFSPCPILPHDQLLSEWNSLSSVARSMAYQSAGSYCETTYIQAGGPFERITDHGAGGEAPCSPTECMGMIWGIANSARLPVEQTNNNGTEVSSPSEVAAEKVFDAHLLQLLGVAISPALGKVEKGQRLSEMLMDIVIDVALNDINLCQRLFFLLRSFIGELEEQKVPHGYMSEQSALAMRCCRYAQRRLSGRMFDKSAGCDGKKERHCSEGYPINRESTRSASTRSASLDFSKLTISQSESSIGANGTSSPLSVGDSGEQKQQQQVLESSSDDVPAIVPSSSHENYDQNSSSAENDDTVMLIKKKSKSKKILQMLKGGKSKKPPSDHNTTATTKSPKSSSKSFSFPKFNKQQHASSSPALETIDCGVPSNTDIDDESESVSLSRKFENMAFILRQLDNSCATIERNLMKSFSQKMADWALYPWSESKESALASVTQSFRTELRLMNPSTSSSSTEARFPILNPVDPSELLTSVDADECFILPSAHFPLLLCFNSEHHVVGSPRALTLKKKVLTCCEEEGLSATSSASSSDTLYRTKVELIGLRSELPPKMKEAFVIRGAVAGIIQESGVSDASRRSADSSSYRWTSNNTLVFETRSNWGFPKTLSLKVSSMSKSDGPDEEHRDTSDVGCSFVDLCPIWEQSHIQGLAVELKTNVYLFHSSEEFDQHGSVCDEPPTHQRKSLELHLRISTGVVSLDDQPRKRLLLYKHGDDLRQELLAIQFIERCNQILLASGLDLKLKTFSCQPVGSKTGFIEWVRGTVPLSELCKSSGSSHPGSNAGVDSRQSSRSKDLLTAAEGEASGSTRALEEASGQAADSLSLSRQSHRWFKYDALPGLRQTHNGSVIDNPIQDFLRSAAYDESAPYLIKKDVMATYVKSCAGYCVITYLLGVGDRHLDNILLHQNGHLLHCDYSFVLGQDPKTYLPMRITEEMIKGFGGKDSDNFAKFLVFTGAAFLTLRRHNNIHSLLSHICNMVHAGMADLSINQPPDEAILAMRGRFRLDLSDDDAMAYIEDVVEKSITSKMWRAVDVMHSLGKHF